MFACAYMLSTSPEGYMRSAPAVVIAEPGHAGLFARDPTAGAAAAPPPGSTPGGDGHPVGVGVGCAAPTDATGAVAMLQAELLRQLAVVQARPRALARGARSTLLLTLRPCALWTISSGVRLVALGRRAGWVGVDGGGGGGGPLGAAGDR